MNKHYKQIALVLSLTISCHAMSADHAPEHNQPIVEHSERSKKTSWLLQSSHGFMVHYPETDNQKEKIADTSLTISTKNGKLFFNGTKNVANRIVIEPTQGQLIFQGVAYDDPLEIIREKKRIIIKCVHTIKLANTEDQEKGAQNVKVAQQKSRDFTVRVLLDEQEQVTSSPWKLHSKKGFMIMNPLQPSKKQKIEAQELVIKTDQDGLIVINGQPMYTLQAYITPIDNTITFNDKHYRGSIWLLAEGTTNKLINCIAIEDYVATVLSTESWPGWSLETNKVLAIACRTYVVAMVQNARTMKRSYHVKNTNKHQTYGGGTVIEVHQQAVDQTKGVFVAYNNMPITAMFDGCCGGIITKDMHGVDFKKAPYLARDYACTYCKKFKISTWQADYSVDELEAIVQKEASKLRRLRDVKITKKDKAGIVQQIHFKGSGNLHTLSGKRVYSLLNKKVKSFHYSVERNGSIITFKGRGYGHHLGLCQWGAKEMTSQGWNHKDVLSFYYPGTQLMRML